MAQKQAAVIARAFVATGMAEFGVQQLVVGRFVRWVAKLPAWVPAPAVWPYATGLVFLAGGAAILFRKRARSASLILSTMILAIAVILHPFEIASNPGIADLWGRAGKAFALSGAAALVAGSLREERTVRGIHLLERLIPLGPFFLSAFFCIAGLEHFIYAPFVKEMVPAWIPGRQFWTYFTGIALLSGGMGMLVPPVARLAATLCGAMVFSWVILLHIPRAIANPHTLAETTAIFEALAISGAAFLVAERRQTGA